ncbi:hypothetical protein C8F04DRAFT_1113750 [Mycena alexandri]|uniref:Uncharacterized protein n=1 Tax=Mycena alexandri TaxID=1745969 RepID=A0AAD6SMH9_9AGAR|nr:hypothetical protein C8F04DRAFT_1113750 [Mycena alexandri]
MGPYHAPNPRGRPPRQLAHLGEIGAVCQNDGPGRAGLITGAGDETAGCSRSSLERGASRAPSLPAKHCGYPTPKYCGYSVAGRLHQLRPRRCRVRRHCVRRSCPRVKRVQESDVRYTMPKLALKHSAAWFNGTSKPKSITPGHHPRSRLLQSR